LWNKKSIIAEIYKVIKKEIKKLVKVCKLNYNRGIKHENKYK